MGLLDSLFNHWSATQQAQLNFEQSKQLQEHQYEINRRALREYYSNNRYSLENAGYNPLLAVPGSTAQGFSASASMGSAPGQGSGIGTDELNSVSSALSAKQQRKLTQKQVESVEQDVKNKKLQNKKLENEINSSPRTVIGELIKNGSSQTGNSAIARLTQFKNAYGLGAIRPRSFVKTQINRLKSLANRVKSVNSAVSSQQNGKPFELGATYNYYSKKKDDEIGIWNSNKKVKGHYLSDDEVRRYSKHKSSNNYDRPPKNFPSGM